MIEQITDYFNNGLLSETFHAERNILIWQYVSEEISFLKTQKKDTQSLYQFIQYSAQTNFILSLGKLFDSHNNKYPSRSILSFLRLIGNSSFDTAEIVETTSTKRLLQKFNCPQDLIDAVDNLDIELFPKLLSQYYLEKYNCKILQEDILTLKSMRDKTVAHNEAIENLNIDFKTTQRLINFTMEIVSIFGMAYYSKSYMLTKSAENSTFFIKANIAELKKQTI